MSRFRKESEDFQETRKLSRTGCRNYGTHLPQPGSLAKSADDIAAETTTLQRRQKMRNIFLKALGAIALAISLSTMFAPAWGSAQNGGGRLEGTWDVQVTIRNCQTGAEIRTFASLTTFIFGGITVDSTSGTPQALKTPGQGVWSHLSGDTYRFSFKSFSFDAGNNFTGWTKITHDATLDSNGSQYTSAGTAEVHAPNGALIFTGCSTTTATRFE
jgi:hypothetical protein